MDKSAFHGALAALLCLSLSGLAQAQIVKCKDASGQITYTSNECPPGTHPLDLPDGVSGDAGSSFHPDRNSKPLSPRAAELKKNLDSCKFRGSEAACSEYREVEKFCADRSHWQSADCVALREVTADFLSRMDKGAEKFRVDDRKKCSEDQDKKAKAEKK